MRFPSLGFFTVRQIIEEEASACAVIRVHPSATTDPLRVAPDTCKQRGIEQCLGAAVHDQYLCSPDRVRLILWR